MIVVNVTSNRDLVESASAEAIERALEACGLQAEKYAKMKCPVDTGLLRNSISHAVGGNAFSGTYHASYGSNRTKKGNRVRATSKNAGSVKIGSYAGSGATGSKGDKTVYIGTNVEYAAYVELGTMNPKRNPKPYLKPALLNHVNEYKKIIEEYLKNG